MRNFVNPAFAEIYDGITSRMPSITFYGIVAVYAITAGLNVYFIPLPLYLSIPAAAAIQFARFAVVFMDFLNPTGNRSPWPPLIATAATITALVELAFSIQDMQFADTRFWSLFLFGGMLIALGWLLEINFISKGAEAFGMSSGKRTTGAATANTHHRHEGEAYRPTLEGITNGYSSNGYSYTTGNGKMGN